VSSIQIRLAFFYSAPDVSPWMRDHRLLVLLALHLRDAGPRPGVSARLYCVSHRDPAD